MTPEQMAQHTQYYPLRDNELIVQTPYGQTVAVVTDWGVILDANSNGRFLTVNRVPYQAFVRYDARGTATLTSDGHDYLRRADAFERGLSYYASQAKPSVNQKVIQTLLPIAQGVWDQHQEMATEQRRRRNAARRVALELEIGELRGKLAELEAELAGLD